MKAPYGQGSFSHCTYSVTQRLFLLERDCCPAHMVCPITNLLFWNAVHMELCTFGKVQALQFNYTVLFPRIRDVNSLINSQTIDPTELMVYMNAKW